MKPNIKVLVPITTAERKSECLSEDRAGDGKKLTRGLRVGSITQLQGVTGGLVEGVTG